MNSGDVAQAQDGGVHQKGKTVGRQAYRVCARPGRRGPAVRVRGFGRENQGGRLGEIEDWRWAAKKLERLELVSDSYSRLRKCRRPRLQAYWLLAGHAGYDHGTFLP